MDFKYTYVTVLFLALLRHGTSFDGTLGGRWKSIKADAINEGLADLVSDPHSGTKNIVKGLGATAATSAAGACAFLVWNPIGWIGCGALALGGVVTAIVAPDYFAPDPRIKNCDTPKRQQRINFFISKGATESDATELVDSWCELQCIYPTRIAPIGGDRCENGVLKPQ